MHARIRSVDVTTSLSVVTASKKIILRTEQDRGVTETPVMSSTEDVPRVAPTAGSLTKERTRDVREVTSPFFMWVEERKRATLRSGRRFLRGLGAKWGGGGRVRARKARGWGWRIN